MTTELFLLYRFDVSSHFNMDYPLIQILSEAFIFNKETFQYTHLKKDYVY